VSQILIRILEGWACDDVTLYLVASDEARRQLIDYGIAPERIKISGMPFIQVFFSGDDPRASPALLWDWLRKVHRLSKRGWKGRKHSAHL